MNAVTFYYWSQKPHSAFCFWDQKFYNCGLYMSYIHSSDLRMPATHVLGLWMPRSLSYFQQRLQGCSYTLLLVLKSHILQFLVSGVYYFGLVAFGTNNSTIVASMCHILTVVILGCQPLTFMASGCQFLCHILSRGL